MYTTRLVNSPTPTNPHLHPHMALVYDPTIKPIYKPMSQADQRALAKCCAQPWVTELTCGTTGCNRIRVFSLINFSVSSILIIVGCYLEVFPYPIPAGVLIGTGVTSLGLNILIPVARAIWVKCHSDPSSQTTERSTLV